MKLSEKLSAAVNKILLVSVIASPPFLASCSSNTTDPNSSQCDLQPIDDDTFIEGYEILNKLPGIWNGPVSSSTPLGSYDEWIVDFRPISPSQISAKNELDSLNDIFMSFFIVKYDCEYKIAFRNGGSFAGRVRNAYMILEEFEEEETQSFYRFADPISGGNRVYTDIVFKKDSLKMHVYTNKYNSLDEPVTHMVWKSKLKDLTSSEDAFSFFKYPQRQVTRDFSKTFDGLEDAVFYSAEEDPYPEEAQPYLSNADVAIEISNPTQVETDKKVLIIVTTRPLFDGFIFNADNLDFRSRYVFVRAKETIEYNFNYMHPGEYYLNTIYDSNGDFIFSSGDYMNLNFDVPLIVEENTNNAVNVKIDFRIP